MSLKNDIAALSAGYAAIMARLDQSSPAATAPAIAPAPLAPWIADAQAAAAVKVAPKAKAPAKDPNAVRPWKCIGKHTTPGGRRCHAFAYPGMPGNPHYIADDLLAFLGVKVG